jgi:hypothetical protein
MRARRILMAAVFATGLASAHVAGGQSPPPPCPANVAAQPTFDARDLDEYPGDTLVATHSLQVSADFQGSFPAPDDSSVVVSIPCIQGTAKPGRLTFFSDTPGTLPVNATWTQDDGTGRGTCSASASSTLQLIPATPIPRFKSRDFGVKTNLKYALNWIFGADLAPTADHDPVLVQWRGWRRSKLPDASVPFKTLTAPLRRADPGYYQGVERKLPLPRMVFKLTAATDIVAIHLDSITSTHHARPVAYDIELSQAGRLLARFRLAGACSAFNCTMRTVKVQR